MAASPGSASTSSTRCARISAEAGLSPESDAPENLARRRLYGRRRGRRLRPGQRELQLDLLPRLAVTLPDGAGGGTAFDPRRLFAATPEAPELAEIGPDEIWLEIGFGAGEHLAAQAAAHPGIGFIGAEVFENGVARLLAEIRRSGLPNIRLFTEDARLLLAALPEAALGRVFILFPDPWPKERHHKRRLVSRDTLDNLARAMRDGAELRLATDDPGYLRWMLERAPSHPEFEWLARRPADWRERPADWPQSRYEAKAIAAGRSPAFLRLRRRPRGAASG